MEKCTEFLPEDKQAEIKAALEDGKHASAQLLQSVKDSADVLGRAMGTALSMQCLSWMCFTDVRPEVQTKVMAN